MKFLKSKLAFLLALLIAFTPLVGIRGAGAEDADSITPDYIKSHEAVLQGSSFQASINGEGYDHALAVYISPSGNKVSSEGKKEEGSDNFVFEVTPLEKGIYSLESLNLTGPEGSESLDGRSLDGNFESCSSMEEIYGESGPLIDASYMTDDLKLTSDGLNAVANSIRAYDAKGNPIPVKVDIDGVLTYEVLNEGFSRTTDLEENRDWDLGSHQITFKADGCESKAFKVEVVANDSETSIVKRGNVRLASLDSFYRVWGKNRYETAVQISNYTWSKADSAFLVNSNTFADALSASSLAYKLKGPILYTDQNYLPSQTVEELNRLGVKNVYLIGGDARIGKGVESQLSKSYKVKRIAGRNRYLTSGMIADELQKKDNQKTFILVNNESATDALIAAPYSSIKSYPVLYTTREGLDADLKNYLKGKDFDKAILVGGSSSISENAENELKSMGIDTERSSGSNAYETSVNFAKNYLPSSKRVVIAGYNGGDVVDALAAGPMAADKSAPVLFTEKDSLPKSVIDFTKTLPLESSYLVGGDRTVSENIIRQMDSIVSEKTGVSTLSKNAKQVNELVQKEEANKAANQDKKPSGKKPKIMLDPGHGWHHNQGAVKSYYEGDMSIKLATMLREELLKYGFEVDMTRTLKNGSYGTPDQVLSYERSYASSHNLKRVNNQIHSLKARGSAANGYDLFISIHSNAAGESVRGSEIYDDVSSPNKALCQSMINTVSSTFGHNNRGVKYKTDSKGRNWYGVLKYSGAKSGMLLEHGFHTNTSDCEKLNNDAFLRQMAKNEAATLAKYYGLK